MSLQCTHCPQFSLTQFSHLLHRTSFSLNSSSGDDVTNLGGGDVTGWGGGDVTWFAGLVTMVAGVYFSSAKTSSGMELLDWSEAPNGTKMSGSLPDLFKR